MGKVQKLEQEIQELSNAELSAFRKWFAEYDARAWDRQIEEDIQGGKLDALAEKALKSHSSGDSSKL
jgi:hypothetical protein